MLFDISYVHIFLTFFPICLIGYTHFIPNLDTIKGYFINIALVSINKYTEYSLIAQKIYVSNSIIQKTGTIVYNIYLLCHKTIYNYKIEPNTTLTGKKINVWINTILYLDDYNNFEESYDFLSDDNESIQPCLFMYNDIVDKNKHIDYTNYLMIMKFYDTYLVNINLHSGLDCLRTPETFTVDALLVNEQSSQHNEIEFAILRNEHEPNFSMPRIEVNSKNNVETNSLERIAGNPVLIISGVSFLTIQYTHPRQPYPVTIVLPKGMYTIGNELFSPIFVLRCLKYQTQPYYFDMNYSLKIIDNNIDIIKLTSKQYIKIEEKTYKIIKIV